MAALTPMKAIRLKCVDCCVGSRKGVVLCPAQECPLHQYRLGKNPRRAKIGIRGPENKQHTGGDKEHIGSAELLQKVAAQMPGNHQRIDARGTNQ